MVLTCLLWGVLRVQGVSRHVVRVIIVIISSILADKVFLTIIELLLWLITALMHDADKCDFPGKEYEWNIAEEDHQEQAAQGHRGKAIVHLDIVENRVLYVLLTEHRD